MYHPSDIVAVKTALEGKVMLLGCWMLLVLLVSCAKQMHEPSIRWGGANEGGSHQGPHAAWCSLRSRTKHGSGDRDLQ